ncbi:thiamine pyrophosphate-binding protein, partial [Nocardia abscessus]|uniref:thiamine pyrophosphate-binding protein n=1 Tax=Nocardia abscessus TaxID=120957 RepID=UPI002454F3CF
MNPSTAQAQVVVDELVRGGVRDVVLCPGSRNAPLAFALQAADAAGRLRLHMRIDERTAGFLAVGGGRARRRPGPGGEEHGLCFGRIDLDGAQEDYR